MTKEFDENRYDKRGFDKKGIHKVTKSIYDEEGYDVEGFNENNYDREGYNRAGYNKEGFNREGDQPRGYYDREGYTTTGYDKKGYDREGYDIFGFNREGYNREGKEYIDIQSKEEAIALLERRSNRFAEAYAILPPDYKRDKDVIITAMRIKGGKRVYEEFVPEDCKNDIDIAGIYLGYEGYDYDKIPIEIKEKLQNPMEIQEAILKYPGIAMACIDHGDISKIPDELIANPEFIKNITKQAYTSSRANSCKLMSKSEDRFRQIKDRIPRDNIENMIDIYKAFPNDVVFKGTELEENAEFILRIAELLVKGIETPGYTIKRRKGVAEFASKKLLSDPKFISEAINRGVDGLFLRGEIHLDDYKPTHQYIKELIEDENYLFNVATGIDIEKVDIEQLPQELQVIIRNRPEFIEKMEEVKEQQEKSEELKRGILETTIKDLNLSTRSFNGLRRAGIHTIQDLLHRTKQELLKFKNLGKDSTNEIISKLEEYGFVFNEDGELELGDIEETVETEELQDEHNETETRSSSGEQIIVEDKTQEELEGMSEEELQQIIANNDQTIANNDQTIEENNIAIKKALVQRILAQQETIAEQKKEMNRLNNKRRSYK